MSEAVKAPKKVHVITENEDGVVYVALVTTSVDKARAKYCDIIKANGAEVDDADVGKRHLGERSGLTFGVENGTPNAVVLIDGKWHYTTDDMDETFAQWTDTEVME